MSIRMTYLLFVSALLVILFGIWHQGIEEKKNIVLNAKKSKGSREKDKRNELNNLFLQVGMKFNGNQYGTYRYGMLALYILWGGIQYFSVKFNVTYYLIIGFGLYILTYPTLYFGKFQSPLLLSIQIFRRFNLRKRESEIYRLLIQLKNIAITQLEQGVSLDETLKAMIHNSQYNTRTLIRYLVLARDGKMIDAYEEVCKDIPSDSGEAFASILTAMYHLSPVELLEHIEIALTRIIENRITEKQERQERSSDFMYIPILIPAFMILLNFIIVTLWVNLKII